VIQRATVTALSPIVHAEGTEGNVALQRTITRWDADTERIVEVPFVSGNSVRGILRDIGAVLAVDHLRARGELSGAAVHALASGGALVKAAKPMTSSEEHRLKELVPHVALFACSGGGRIMRGRLAVNHLMPLENIPLDSLTTEQFGTRSAQLPHGLIAEEHEGDQMIYEFQAIPAGVQFSWGVTVSGSNADPMALAARAWLGVVLDAWIADGAYIGAKNASGYGLVSVDWDTEPEWGPPPAPLTDDERAEAIELLNRL
jgi:hypothetical protein